LLFPNFLDPMMHKATKPGFSIQALLHV